MRRQTLTAESDVTRREVHLVEDSADDEVGGSWFIVEQTIIEIGENSKDLHKLSLLLFDGLSGFVSVADSAMTSADAGVALSWPFVDEECGEQ